MSWYASLPPEWVDGLPETIFDRARGAYETPGRFYHTWDHALACVEEMRSIPCEVPRTVLLALVFHDAVHVPGRSDNESQSADLAVRVLCDNTELAPRQLADVHRIILATGSHEPDADAGHDLRVALDIDMSILGAAPDRYDAYAEGIRLEYCPAVVAAEAYAAGRADFLSRLLAMPAIFSTPEGVSRWEMAARANIARELSALAGMRDQRVRRYK